MSGGIMTNKKYSVAVFGLLLIAAEASVINSKLPPQLLDDGQRWGDIGLSANVNEYVDNTIQLLIPFVETHGLDPMPLPDMEEGFEVKPLLITYSAWLRIHDGFMTGLERMSRSGDQSVHYFAKMLRVRIKLEFADIDFVYRYLVKVMDIGPTGGIVGSLDRFVVTVDLLIDFNNDEVHLQEFSLTELGRLRVRLTGNVLTDWLVNPVVNVFVRLFDTVIIKYVENNIHSIVQEGIDFVNSNVKEIISAIESSN